MVVAEAPIAASRRACIANATEPPSVETILARLELDREPVQADFASPISEPPDSAVNALAWYAFEPFAIAF